MTLISFQSKTALAPLVVPDKNELGDKRLNEVEGLAAFREKRIAADRKRDIPNQELLSDKDAAKGRILPVGEFLNCIQRLNPNLVIRQSSVWNRPSVAIYAFSGEELKYISGFFVDTGFLPEYTALDCVDERGHYSRTIRGWREVLVHLVKAGAISVLDVKNKLGNAVGSRSDGAWNKQLRPGLV